MEKTGKKILIFGFTNRLKIFIAYLLKKNVKIEVVYQDSLDENANTFLTANKVNIVNQKDLKWSDVECLVLIKTDESIGKLAKIQECPVYSLYEFLSRYYPNNEYIALIGETGSAMTSSIINYLLCASEKKYVCEFCNYSEIDYIRNPENSDIYLVNLAEQSIGHAKDATFNIVILFDLNYSGETIQNIRELILKQTDDGFVIINIDNKDSKEFYKDLMGNENYLGKIIPISSKKILDSGFSYVSDEVHKRYDGEEEECLVPELKNLLGYQNKINILSSLIVLRLKNISLAESVENLQRFKPICSVFETVIVNNNMAFINDIENKNKKQALNSFENIYCILTIKNLDFNISELSSVEDNLNSLKAVFIVGESDNRVGEFFEDNDIDFYISSDLEDAFNSALSKAKELGEDEKTTILLSSVSRNVDDEFYKKQSEAFKKLVKTEIGK